MTSATSVPDLSAIDLMEAMNSGALRATDVMDAFLGRIAEDEPSIRAWATIDIAGAMLAAQQADTLRRSGAPVPLLLGLPVGVKDIIDTADMPTSYGCAGYAARQPSRDATIVARLRRAGAIVVGKTATAEFAFKHPGPTRNPHDPSKTPGGSSGGSAAAVAAKMIPVALGTQTKGSVIRPAAYCGVVGYKPGLGVLPRTGILSQSLLLDQPGVIARSVADAAMLAGVMSGHDSEDPMSSAAPPIDGLAHPTARPPRLALLREPYWGRADLDSQRRINALAEELELDPVSLPQRFADVERAIDLMVAHGIAAATEREPPLRMDLLSSDLLEAVRVGKAATQRELDDARHLRVLLIEQFATLMENYDALITLSTTGPAPPFALGTGDPVLAVTATFVGAPAMTLPLLQSNTGLPLGVQLIGRPAGDRDLILAGKWLEQCIPRASLP